MNTPTHKHTNTPTPQPPGFTGTEDFADLLAKSPGSLMYSWASPELVELMTRRGGADGDAAQPGGTGLSMRQVGGGPEGQGRA